MVLFFLIKVLNLNLLLWTVDTVIGQYSAQIGSLDTMFN